MVAMLALAIFINYVDRGNLATAGPLIKDELHLSNTEFGLLVSAFFWTYNPSQLLAGWLAQRFNTYWVMAAGLCIWAAATTLSGWATSLAMLMGLRLLLGLGESVAVPCSSKLVAERVPLSQLGKANGVINVGLALGPAFGTFFGGLIMARAGWRATFVIFGLSSLVWLAPWLIGQPRRTAQTPNPRAPAPGYRAIIRQRSAWGASLGHFCTSYSVFFVLSWLPLYLVKARGLSIAQMATFGGALYLMQAASSVAFGWLSDAWIRSVASITRVRKSMVTVGFVLNAATMAICAVSDLTISASALFVAAMVSGLLGCNIFTIAQTLAGPRAAAKWVGFQSAIGNMAGVVAPLVTGYLVDLTGKFTLPFIVAGCVSLLGVVGLVLVVKKLEPIEWSPPQSEMQGA